MEKRKIEIAKRYTEAAKLVTWDVTLKQEWQWFVRGADGGWKRNIRAAKKILAQFGFTLASFVQAQEIQNAIETKEFIAALKIRKATIEAAANPYR